MMIRILALAALSALAGCAIGSRTVDEHITVSPDAGGKVFVTSNRMIDGANGYRTFRAVLHNDYDYERAVEWRVVWLDAEGVELEMAASTWNKVEIPAGGQVQIRNTATQTEAADYRFHLRKLKEPKK